MDSPACWFRKPSPSYIPDNCQFRDGLSQLSDVSSATNVRVVGLLLKNPTNGNTVLVGHYVDDLD